MTDSPRSTRNSSPASRWFGCSAKAALQNSVIASMSAQLMTVLPSRIPMATGCHDPKTSVLAGSKARETHLRPGQVVEEGEAESRSDPSSVTRIASPSPSPSTRARPRPMAAPVDGVDRPAPDQQSPGHPHSRGPLESRLSASQRSACTANRPHGGRQQREADRSHELHRVEVVVSGPVIPPPTRHRRRATPSRPAASPARAAAVGCEVSACAEQRRLLGGEQTCAVPPT